MRVLGSAFHICPVNVEYIDIVHLAGREMLEMTQGNETRQLRENLRAAIHGNASFAKKTSNDTEQKPLAISNRQNRKSHLNPCQY